MFLWLHLNGPNTTKAESKPQKVHWALVMKTSHRTCVPKMMMEDIIWILKLTNNWYNKNNHFYWFIGANDDDASGGFWEEWRRKRGGNSGKPGRDIELPRIQKSNAQLFQENGFSNWQYYEERKCKNKVLRIRVCLLDIWRPSQEKLNTKLSVFVLNTFCHSVSLVNKLEGWMVSFWEFCVYPTL